MAGARRSKTKPVLVVLVAAAALLAASRLARAAAKLDGRWQVTVTIPEAPGSRNTRDLALNLNVAPLGDSLVGRLTVTDAQNRTLGGVWRQVGKQVAITYELPCTSSDAPCASLILMGKVKGDLLKKGQVIVLWDTPNNENPALYETSNGAFSGFRLE